MEFTANIRYNAIKHYKSSMVDFIRDHKGEVETLKSKLSILGESKMDVYLGNLSVDELCKELVELMQGIDVFEINKFNKWLDDNGGYQILAISDSSKWIMRRGEDHRYIHIHPARYSPLTMRVKALTLKAVIATLICCSRETLRTEDVNHTRVNVLGLSPINTLKSNSSFYQIHQLLSEDYLAS